MNQAFIEQVTTRTVLMRNHDSLKCCLMYSVSLQLRITKKFPEHQSNQFKTVPYGILLVLAPQKPFLMMQVT